jgi:hypothetical protein
MSDYIVKAMSDLYTNVSFGGGGRSGGGGGGGSTKPGSVVNQGGVNYVVGANSPFYSRTLEAQRSQAMNWGRNRGYRGEGPTARQVGNVAGVVGLGASIAGGGVSGVIGAGASVVGLAANNW